MPSQIALARAPSATRARPGRRLNGRRCDGGHTGGDTPFHLLLQVIPVRTT
jgi:hypothetical protein